MAEASPATSAPTPVPATPALADDQKAEMAAFTNFFKNLSKRTDIVLALGVVTILVVLILPLPTWAMDLSLAFSITFSVLILMVALFVEKPLEFNTFPTILLLATMIRLALNLASTRLILAHGHEGTDAAGQVIEAFGGFVMGNNFVIGIIVFAILVIVNFIVITKGSGRIAEVSARFTLDAMPGKQMAIDADLSTGLIDEDEARTRRRDLEDESTFFGAMDGAAKFVRGDAIAGILITFINIIAGMIIGVVQKDLSFAEAADLYTRLTVGDGLVSQIPALIVSTAAGLVVTKAGISGPTEKALFKQLGGQPRALGLVSFLSFGLALLPGMPIVPFLGLSILTGGGAWFVHYRDRQIKEEEIRLIEEKAIDPAAIAEEPISTALRIDYLRLELGYGLLSLISAPKDGQKLTDQIKALRRQMASDIGFVMPSVRIQDNMQLPANTYA
ncbi:MAG: FHIPEP family type III secretion protein, partial [Proteobacteria bacterium]|nr:FHIPEP family type III secretion protein [Pseudomonadota bacterium]